MPYEPRNVTTNGTITTLPTGEYERLVADRNFYQNELSSNGAAYEQQSNDNYDMECRLEDLYNTIFDNENLSAIRNSNVVNDIYAFLNGRGLSLTAPPHYVAPVEEESEDAARRYFMSRNVSLVNVVRVTSRHPYRAIVTVIGHHHLVYSENLSEETSFITADNANAYINNLLMGMSIDEACRAAMRNGETISISSSLRPTLYNGGTRIMPLGRHFSVVPNDEDTLPAIFVTREAAENYITRNNVGWDICAMCGASGTDGGNTDCATCNGRGIVERRVPVNYSPMINFSQNSLISNWQVRWRMGGNQ